VTQGPGVEVAVGVAGDEDFAPRRGRPAVEGRRLAPVPLEADQPRGRRRGQVGRHVDGPVVDDDHLEIGIILVQGAVDRVQDDLLLVVGGDQD
jgi:hypothetical protein